MTETWTVETDPEGFLVVDARRRTVAFVPDGIERQGDDTRARRIARLPQLEVEVRDLREKVTALEARLSNGGGAS